jgi:hypothetical protein
MLLKVSDDNVVRMDDDNPETLECLPEFLYTSATPYPLISYEKQEEPYPSNKNSKFGELVIWAYQLVDKHDQPLLMDIARQQTTLFSRFSSDGGQQLAEAIDMLYSMG